MAKPIEALSIQLKFKDAGSQAVIEKVKNSLAGLQRAASGARPNIKGLRDEILAQGRASIKSVSNINAQRTALMALRDEAKIGGNTFKQLTADIKKLDAQLGKTSKKSGGMGARRATQTAGAIISGGIFGGPEGAIGGALGAFGGVEGAFAGAAIGAQVGMLRQAVGEMANYAASIEKAKIALNGILPNQNDYNFALQVASQATRELNVPQEQSIRGITRLSAAVTGAGGPVQDAATTFRNVTAAIKATGGSSEDVQGAITAMVQVFSKGKVSAEELSGQLGERLPGAVTLFAKANKMTLPELQKNLKAGTVGLNELMNFIVELGNKFNTTAEKISDSNAEAGAKLAVAIQDMQAEVGAALIPIGAQFQVAFAEFIRNITPFLVTNLPKIGRLFLALAKNLDTLAVAAVAAFGVLGVAKLVAIAKAVGSVTAAVTALKGALVAMGLANPFTALAVGAGILAGAIYNASKRQAEFNQLVREGSVAQVDAALKTKQLERDEVIQRRLKFDPTGKGTSAMARMFQEGGAEYEREQRLQREIDQLRERRRVAREDARQGADLGLSLLPRFKYDPVTSEDGGGDGDKSLARRIEQAQRLEQRSEAQLRIAETQGAIGRLLAQQDNQRVALQARINKLLADGADKEIVRATESAKTSQAKAHELELGKKIDALYKNAMRPLRSAVESIKEKIRFDGRYKELLKQGINPERAKAIISIEKAFEKTVELLDTEIDILKAKVAQGDATEAQIEALDRLIKKRKEAEGERDEGIQGTEGVGKKPTFMEGLDGAIKKQEDALKDLINPLNQVIKAADAIGEAFKASFKGIITGSMTAKQALASFFQSIADHFADMAAQIAAEALKLAALKFVKMIVGAMLGGGGGGNTIDVDAVGAYMPGGSSFAQGGYVPGGFKAFNQGGVVSQPTLGMVGEGGEPEYIIPQSKMRESMSRYSRGVRGPGVIPSGGGATAASGGGTAVAAPIDVRYTVERINSVDYVTADQFQRGMQQAAAQGATQGEQRALTTLRQNTSQRKRIGL